MLYTFELIFFALHIIQALDHISFVSTTFEVSCLSPSSFFFSKNKTIIYRYLYNKKFVVNQEIIYLLSLTTFPTIWSTLKRSRFIHFSITLRKEILYSLIPSKIKFREDWNVKIDFSEKFPYVEEISRSYAFLRLPKRMCKSRNITLPCSIVRCLSITWRMVRQ